MNKDRYFFLRKFSPVFINKIHLKLFKIFSKKVDFEIPDIEELKSLSKDTKSIKVYVSGKKSRVEQFLFNGFLIENRIVPPTHSFGSKTVFFMSFKQIKAFFVSFFNKSVVPEKKIKGVYVPIDSPGNLLEQKIFRDVYSYIKNRDVRIIPVVTLWSKELGKKSRWDWMIKITGKYHLWSTTWELLMLLLKRRKLIFRVGLARKLRKNMTPEIFVKKLHGLMQDTRKNVVGVSLKSWLDIKNETLFDLKLKDEVKIKKANEIIDKLATKYSPARAEFYTRVIGRVLKTVFSKYHYSNEEIVHLRRICCMPGTNMILVPTHRSYFDYLILNHLLYSEKVTVPLVAAGDNLSFFPLGTVLRQMGAFFIRRKMKEDLFYRNVVASYLKNVVAAGYDIEFFIEGGRSRSGMVRSPRTGMLKMLAENGRKTGRKLFVVPVSITYEKLKEIEDYKKEKKEGKTLEKENFFTRIRTLIKTRYGPVYIKFARPIYLSGKFSEQTAYRIAEYQEKATVISFSALFSTVFLCNEELTSNDVVEKMEYSVNQMRLLPFVVTAPALDNLDVNCSRLIRRLMRKGDIIEANAKKGVFLLSQEAFYEFSYYKNSIAFAFAPFMVELFEDPIERNFVTEFLETVIKGYNSTLIQEGVISRAKMEEWFKKTVCCFFKDSFSLLDFTVKVLMNKKELLKKTSKTALAESLMPVLAKEVKVFSLDEVYEIIFFLEKKQILINNLSEIDDNSAGSILKQISAVMLMMQKGG